MRLPPVQRVAWWGGLAFSCVFLAIWLLNTTGTPTNTHHGMNLPSITANTRDKVQQQHYRHPTPRAQEEVDMVEPAHAQEELEPQLHTGEEIQVDSFILEQKKRKMLLQKSTSISIELETYITYKADDSLADGLEVTRCAQKALLNNSFYKCYQPQHVDNPPYDLTIWSQDYHAAAVTLLKLQLGPLGVKIIDKGLSPHCATFKACGSDLRAVSSLNGINLNDDTVDQFHAEYIADKQFALTDVFLCIRPNAMCELFMPFGKSMLVIIDARLELGRWTLERWNQWNMNIIKLSQDPKHVVAATSQYDVEYVRFYTNCNPILLPPLCAHIIHSYKPHAQYASRFLLFSIRSQFFMDLIMKDFKKHSEDLNATVSLTPVHQPRVDQAAQSLVKQAGIVLIPQAPSSLRMTELYRMNIPIFAPSQELLVRWHVTHGVMAERTWQHVSRLIPRSAGMNMPGRLSLPNPNDEKLESVGFWLNYIDIYMWPNVVYFNSMSDLVMKLQRYSSNPARLVKISRRMEKYNTKEKRGITRKWDSILNMFQNNKRIKNQTSR